MSEGKKSFAVFSGFFSNQNPSFSAWFLEKKLCRSSVPSNTGPSLVVALAWIQ